MRLLSLLLAFAAAAYCLETALLSPAERGKRVPMTLLTDFAKLPLPVRTPDFLLTSNESSPLFCLTGRDQQRHPWRVNLRDAARQAWRSETKGTNTYYFTGSTGATGLGPFTWILAISFDDRGRPVPFFVYTHGGIEDVLDLDGTGPDLLVQDYQGSFMDDPGYFVTALYHQRGPYWHRSDGRHGEHVFPTSEKWSVATWREKPAVLMNPPVFKYPLRDETNDPAGGIKAMITGAGETDVVNVSPESGCRAVAPDVLVRDTPAGRVIELEGFKESLKALAKARATVLLTGLHPQPNSTECSASILWSATLYKGDHEP